MVGEFHIDESHEELTPFASKMIVEIGDVEEYGVGGFSLADNNKPFILEKYISINGQKYNPNTALNSIKSANDINLNISDVYPGTLKLVYPLGQDGEPNTSVRPIGIEGNLGVRYGVQLSIGINGTKFLLAEGEIDAVDTKIGQLAPLEENSKLLLCVLNKLKEDTRFKLVNDYIFSCKKIC